VLAALAVVRPADYQGPDIVEWAITHMAKVDLGEDAKDKAAAAEEVRFKENGFDLSSATHWPDVAEKDVLVAPHEARLAWREFMSASGLSVQQVRSQGLAVPYQAGCLHAFRGRSVHWGGRAVYAWACCSAAYSACLCTWQFTLQMLPSIMLGNIQR
jgi:hypothetical protein